MVVCNMISHLFDVQIDASDLERQGTRHTHLSSIDTTTIEIIVSIEQNPSTFGILRYSIHISTLRATAETPPKCIRSLTSLELDIRTQLIILHTRLHLIRRRLQELPSFKTDPYPDHGEVAFAGALEERGAAALGA